MEISYDNQILISNSESPVVVVPSGSMEPAFRRGDILFLWMQPEPFAVGDVVLFKIDQREIPIVHECIECTLFAMSRNLFTHCAFSIKDFLTYVVAGTSEAMVTLI